MGGTMRIKILILGILCLLLISPALPSNKAHVYITECGKLLGGIHILNTIFYVKVTSEKAENILRIELNCFVKYFSPKADVLATAWYSKRKDEEDMIILSDGKSTNLLFSKKTGKITFYSPY